MVAKTHYSSSILGTPFISGYQERSSLKEYLPSISLYNYSLKEEEIIGLPNDTF